GHDLGYSDFPDEQIEAVIRLCRDIMGRWEIPAHRVLAHSDIAPTRKIDPGEKFPWKRLAGEGIGFYVDPAPIRRGVSLSPGDQGGEVETLQQHLAQLGFGVAVTGIYDAGTMAVVRAFQRHFRPQIVDGIADESTRTTLEDLVSRWL